MQKLLILSITLLTAAGLQAQTLGQSCNPNLRGACGEPLSQYICLKSAHRVNGDQTYTCQLKPVTSRYKSTGYGGKPCSSQRDCGGFGSKYVCVPSTIATGRGSCQLRATPVTPSTKPGRY